MRAVLVLLVHLLSCTYLLSSCIVCERMILNDDLCCILMTSTFSLYVGELKGCCSGTYSWPDLLHALNAFCQLYFVADCCQVKEMKIDDLRCQ